MRRVLDSYEEIPSLAYVDLFAYFVQLRNAGFNAAFRYRAAEIMECGGVVATFNHTLKETISYVWTGGISYVIPLELADT